MAKNTERRKNEWISGECDLFDLARRGGYDLKAAWSAQTFPLCLADIAEAQRRLYEWQFRGYMWLWDADTWQGAYCLTDTPEKLIGYESLQLHLVGHIPEHLRVTTWTVQRDSAMERQMADKVRAARDYYFEFIEEFDRTHKALDLDMPPWVHRTHPGCARACRRRNPNQNSRHLRSNPTSEGPSWKPHPCRASMLQTPNSGCSRSSCAAPKYTPTSLRERAPFFNSGVSSPIAERAALEAEDAALSLEALRLDGDVKRARVFRRLAMNAELLSQLLRLIEERGLWDLAMVAAERSQTDLAHLAHMRSAFASAPNTTEIK